MSHDVTARGFLAGSLLRIALLFIVLAEVTYLAGSYRVRGDLTGDELYTLTSSTQRVLGKLEDLLVIEAYFSPRQSLPILDQPKRTALVNLLEEYEKLGGSRVRVRYIDPLEDKIKRETAERLGMTPQHARVQGSAGVTTVDIWQGIRLRYGGRKQEVVPYLGFPPPGQHSTAYYERYLTPMIKRLMVSERPVIGVLAFSSRPGGRGLTLDPGPRTPPQHFRHLARIFEREYEMRPIDVSKGQLIPTDIKIALLIRPKYLSDRTKFVFDQFLMRGGKLVVFADTCEVEVRADRALRGTVVQYDAVNAGHRFVDMLKHYGVDVRNQIVADGVTQLQQAFYDVRQDQKSGQQTANMFFYPYIFAPANDSWQGLAQDMAITDGKPDPAQAAQNKALVKPGMNTAHDLIKALEHIGGPGLFWPCPVELTDPLPEGVKGQVLLRTSPLSWVDPPNSPLDPFNEQADFQHREHNLLTWTRSKVSMRPRIPQQTSLMVHVEGTFKSYFADQPVPPSPIEDAGKKPKEDDWGADPAKDKASDKGVKDGPLPARPEPEKPAAEAEPKLTEAAKGASLLVIGDATFVRDDFLGGQYTQPADLPNNPRLFGPHARDPRQAVLFVKNLLDWMAEERDLLALQNKTRTDRLQEFGEQDVARQETMDEFRDRIIARSRWIRGLNWVLPALGLGVCGIFVYFSRRARKRVFLASLQR